MAVAVLGNFDPQATSMRVSDVLSAGEGGKSPVALQHGPDHESGRGNEDRGGAMASGTEEGYSCTALDVDGWESLCGPAGAPGSLVHDSIVGWTLEMRRR